MSHEDFDLDRLAAYLHLTPPQVMRLADRGRVPGRKVAGKWRFSQAEIHHWMEDRLGLSAESELVKVETVIERSAQVAGDEAFTVAAMLPLDAIAAPLAAKTRSRVITSMSNLAADTGLLWDPERVAEAVRERENLHPTALGNGVALMHPRRPMPGILGEAFLALGKTEQGIPFGGTGLSDIFFLILSTDDRTHLRVLARLSRLIADGDLLDDIRAAGSPIAVHEAVIEHEQRLIGDA
jgi:PTS system nitrogen regulatory IIA component